MAIIHSRLNANARLQLKVMQGLKLQLLAGPLAIISKIRSRNRGTKIYHFLISKLISLATIRVWPWQMSNKLTKYSKKMGTDNQELS